MAIKNVLYDLGNGKTKDITSSYYDDTNNKLFSEKLSFSSASLNLNYGLVFTENGAFSSSVQQSDQILAWNASTNKWEFTNPTPISTATTPPPANSDLTGAFLSNTQVKSIANSLTGTLKISNGGTGLSASDISFSDDRLLIYDGTSKFNFQTSYGTISSSQNLALPLALASFTSTTTIDQSIYSNTISLGGGTIVSPPAGAPFTGNALRSLQGQTPTVISITPHIGDFTVEGWIYFNNGGGGGLVGATSVIFGNSADRWLPMVAGNGANASTGFFSIWDGSQIQITSVPFQASQWYHIALTRNNNDLRLYANGTGSAVYAAQGGFLQMTSIIPGTNGTTIYNVNGYISDVAFYTFAKTESQIQSYYNSVKSGSQGRRSYDSRETINVTSSNVFVNIDENGKYVTGSASKYHGIKIPISTFDYY